MECVRYAVQFGLGVGSAGAVYSQTAVIRMECIAHGMGLVSTASGLR